MGLLQVVWPLAVSMLSVFRQVDRMFFVLCDLEALLLLPFPEMKSKTEKLFSFLLSLRFFIFKTVKTVPTSVGHSEEVMKVLASTEPSTG